MKETIQSLRDYSGYSVNGHRLLLKVAAHGDNNAWTVANIKYGTPLAKKASKGKSDSNGLHQPIVTIVKNILGEMELMVASSETPKKTKMPEGMKFAKIYRFIGATTSKDHNDFDFYGNANRGKLLVNYKGVNLTGNTKLYACYFGRYESIKGELGEAGPIVYAEILF